MARFALFLPAVISWAGIAGITHSGAPTNEFSARSARIALGLSTSAAWSVFDSSSVLEALATADVNADGYDELITGWQGSSSRTIRVYYGSPAGLSDHPNWWKTVDAFVVAAGDANCDGFDDLVFGDPSQGVAYMFAGSAAGLGTASSWSYVGSAQQSFGTSVALQDVDGDGCAETFVGAPGAVVTTAAGSVFEFAGSPAGPAGAPSELRGDPSFPPGRGGYRFGEAIAAAGDTNRDGYGDIAIGEPSYSDPSPGTFYLWIGRTKLFVGGPAGLDTKEAWSFIGGNADSYTGYPRPAGDANGDGRADLLVLPFYQGPLYLFLGTAQGLQEQPVWRFGDDGPNSGCYYCSAAAVPDLDGDGFGEILIGTPRVDSYSGAAELFFGPPSGTIGLTVWHGTPGSQNLGETSAAIRRYDETSSAVVIGATHGVEVFRNVFVAIPTPVPLSSDGGRSGCQCSTTTHQAAPREWLAALAMIALVRRRR